CPGSSSKPAHGPAWRPSRRASCPPARAVADGSLLTFRGSSLAGRLAAAGRRPFARVGAPAGGHPALRPAADGSLLAFRGSSLAGRLAAAGRRPFARVGAPAGGHPALRPAGRVMACSSPGPFLHPFARPAAGPEAFIKIVRAEGATVWDDVGNTYIDAL